MNKIFCIMISILLSTGVASAQLSFTGGAGVITASDCSSYTAIGQLCQDTDDGKLYKGTGEAVEEVAGGVSTYAEIEALADYPWSAECTGYLKSDGTCGIPGIFGTLDPETDDGKYATLNYNAETEVWEVAAGNTPTNVTAEDGSILKLSGSDIVAATEGTDYAGAGTDIATFAWDGGGSAVGTSLGKACKVVAYAATITQVSLSMDTSATVVIKLYKDAFSDEALPTTDITNGAFVTTTAKRGLVDSTLTDWTVSVSAGDEICAELTTNDSATRASLIISGVR